MSSDNVMARIDKIEKTFQVKNLYFLDDNFFVSHSRAQRITRSFLESDLEWIVHGLTVNDAFKMDLDYLNMLSKSGCTELGIGVESGSDSVLSKIGKSYSREQVIRTNQKLSGCNIRVSYGFISSWPEESREELKQTTSLALQLLKENPHANINHISIFMPLPGTNMFQISLQHGFEPPRNFSDWGKMEFEKAITPWLTKTQKKNAEALFFASLFLKRSMLRKHGINGWFPTILEMLYRPIAVWRVRHLNFNWMFEKFLQKRLHFLFQKYRPQ